MCLPVSRPCKACMKAGNHGPGLLSRPPAFLHPVIFFTRISAGNSLDRVWETRLKPGYTTPGLILGNIPKRKVVENKKNITLRTRFRITMKIHTRLDRIFTNFELQWKKSWCRSFLKSLELSMMIPRTVYEDPSNKSLKA